MKILIDTVYLNSFGGRELLQLIIDKLFELDAKDHFFFLLDTRSNVDIKGFKHLYCKPNLSSRKKFYNRNKGVFEKIICLSNIPPPIKISEKKVIIFFHNALLLSNKISIISNYLKRIYILIHSQVNYEWIVQTDYMKGLLSKKININDKRIHVYPFFRPTDKAYNIIKPSNEINLLYVTSNSSHKNNRRLISGFKQADSKNKKITLYLTIDGKNLISKNKSIIYLGNISKEQLYKYYSLSHYLLYPSIIESLGLPLIECLNFNCKILVSNAECFKDVIEPSSSFNPYSIKSIKETIEKVVNLNNIKPSRLLTSNKLESFINFIHKHV